MKRPQNYAYWLDDKPPLGVTVLSGFQHIGLVCGFLPIPLAIAREAGLTDGRVVDVISVSMLVLGITAILVITSYSIHYTKLYDTRRTLSCRERAGDPRP